MYWGRSRLEEALQSRAIEFEGGIRSEGLLLTAGGPVQFLAGGSEPVDLLDASAVEGLYGDSSVEWTQIVLQPKQMVLIQAGERIALKGQGLGVIGTLSHLARCGLMAHLASPFVSPAFAGYITLEVFNAADRALILTRGMPLAKVMVADVVGHLTSAHLPYYGERGHLASRLATEFGTNDGV